MMLVILLRQITANSVLYNIFMKKHIQYGNGKVKTFQRSLQIHKKYMVYINSTVHMTFFPLNSLVWSTHVFLIFFKSNP